MGTYIPHKQGTIQTIVSGSLTQYQAYASPSQTILDRLEHFAGCADWPGRLPLAGCSAEPPGRKVLHEFAAKIADIRTSGHFRVRFFTFVPRATKNERYYTLNIWPRNYCSIYHIASSCLPFQKS
jgi:hypothetical protein